MKHLYIIGGTMGVGKTTTCQILKNRLDNCVFLDGDWCWDSSPFQVMEETKAMAEDNICYLLNRFLHCSAYTNILFCWVMHEQSIIDHLMAALDLNGVQLHLISLVCSEAALRTRLAKDVETGKRTADVIERSIARIPLYHELNTRKVDVSEITAEEAADQIQHDDGFSLICRNWRREEKK